MPGGPRNNAFSDPDSFRAGFDVSRETMASLEIYADLLVKWQKAINLVGRDTLADLWRRHFADSAQIAAHLPKGCALITDLGSGAGFPGLVLSIMTGIETRLVESAGKKAQFLMEVIRATGANATVCQERIEAANHWPSDVITARALAPLDMLLDYAAPFCREAELSTECLFLKGRRADQELTEAAQRWNISSDQIASITDPEGVLLKIREFARV